MNPENTDRNRLVLVDGAGGYLAYAKTKLLNLGFRLRYPSFREGWRESVKWCRENRWLPPA